MAEGPKGDAMSTNTSEIGGNTHVVSTGTNNYLWVDKDNDGKVDAGDLLVLTAQANMSTYTHVVGNQGASYAHGDPHLAKKQYTAGEEKQVVAAFSQVFTSDEKTAPSTLALANVDRAVATVGTMKGIIDFQASIGLQLTDGTKLRYHTVAADGSTPGVNGLGKSVAEYTDKVDIDVTDASGKARTITIDKVFAGRTGAGQSVVKEGDRASSKDAALPQFYEVKGANVMHGVQIFGEAAGTATYAMVVNNSGGVDGTLGKMTAASIKFYDDMVKCNDSDVLRFALTLGDDGDDETRAQEARLRTAAPGARAVQAR
jgi:hypothetical protein